MMDGISQNKVCPGTTTQLLENSHLLAVRFDYVMYSISVVHDGQNQNWSSGGVVVKLLACGARGQGLNSWSGRYNFRY